VAQRVGRGIALLFHDRGTRRRWVVSSTARPHFTPGKDPVPILQDAGWAPGTIWAGGKSRPNRDSIPDRPARRQSLYWLSYPAHTHTHTHIYIYIYKLLTGFPLTPPKVSGAAVSYQRIWSSTLRNLYNGNSATVKNSLGRKTRRQPAAKLTAVLWKYECNWRADCTLRNDRYRNCVYLSRQQTKRLD